MRGFALYNPNVGAPEGGLCVSAFALLRQGDAFLVLKPAPHPRWAEWAPNWDLYDLARLRDDQRCWRLPAAYLKEGEAPEDAARRVVEGQLGAKPSRMQGPRVRSFASESRRFPGKTHWDLCFVFEVEAQPAPLRALPWLAELRWAKPGELAGDDFGSAIGDLVADLGLARHP
jgi:ADP-ribose pyrophosphatase YjhB (NUDIX family)